MCIVSSHTFKQSDFLFDLIPVLVIIKLLLIVKKVPNCNYIDGRDLEFK